MPSDSPAPLPARPLQGALLFDATSPSGRRAAARFFNRFAEPRLRLASRAERRAAIAALCGEDFCRRLEVTEPGLPWELV